MATVVSADFTDDSIAAYLGVVADRLHACANKATQGDWSLSAQTPSFIVDHSGGVLAGAVHSANARLICGAASPESVRAAADTLRALAALPPSNETRPALHAALTMAAEFDTQMRLKADSALQRIESPVP